MTDAGTDGGSFERYMEHVPAAFAVTRGAQHTLVSANATFRRLIAASAELALGRPIVDAIEGRDTKSLITLLDRVLRIGVVARDHHIEPLNEGSPAWCCTVWPAMNGDGKAEYLIIELREATDAEHTLALQREVAERMLLTALREHDAADASEVSRRGAAFLAAEGRRLAESLDEGATLDAMTRMALPYAGAWCIVDTIDRDHAIRRLTIVHQDPAKQELVRELEGRWSPETDDRFGVPAMLRSAETTLLTEGIDEALVGASRNPEILRILQALGIGPLLTVPLVIRDELAGAVTFVSGQRRPFTPEDVALAEDLATRSAMALDRARSYGKALALKREAESASYAKSMFLGSMSHELRTPLNAIGGYVDLIDMGLRGPVTASQHNDLDRIRRNQEHLLGLINDLLNFTAVGSGLLSYDIGDVIAHEVLASSVELVEPLMMQKQIACEQVACDDMIVVHADREKLRQILVNLLSNAIKFAPSGARVTVGCDATKDTVLIHVSDTGIGIPEDKLKTIFEPFVQVKAGLSDPGGGVGLGLAISRSLARAMHGDLTVESTLGKGARFTVTLPRASGESKTLPRDAGSSAPNP